MTFKFTVAIKNIHNFVYTRVLVFYMNFIFLNVSAFKFFLQISSFKSLKVNSNTFMSILSVE